MAIITKKGRLSREKEYGIIKGKCRAFALSFGKKIRNGGIGLEKEKIIVGLSGGVDSSVTAYLLKQQGYEVIGVTMQTQGETSGQGNNFQAVEDAAKVARQLGIAHYVMDFTKEFRHHVMDTFTEAYFSGRTPNPCVACNRYVKWQALLEQGKALGAYLVATGHYANVETHPVTGRLTLRMSKAKAKDQTYVLYDLTQEQLAATKMPLGQYTKESVRQLAQELGIAVAEKPDSMEICFIPDHDYAAFLERYGNKTAPRGSFVDQEGRVLGQHKGIIHYTVGQRKGLGIALGRPVFVGEIRPEQNEVVLCDNDSLFHSVVYAKNVNWMGWAPLTEPCRAEAKIRYSHLKAACTVERVGDLLKCTFDTPQRAMTPGQALVVYDGDYVACGGTIDKTE